MQVDYKAFIDRMIGKYEGPYGWNKSDPGGPTKYGITCYDLAEHRGQKMTSMATWAPIVQAMPLAEAEDIYQTKYAKGVQFDLLPAGPDVTILDYAVNSGLGRTNAVVPAIMGTKTYAAAIAAMERADPKWVVDQICAERLRFMHAIRGGSAWVEFGRGWQARVDDLRGYGEHLVAGGTHETAPPPTPAVVPTPKAQHVPSTLGAKTAGGVVAAGVAAHAAGASWLGVGIACAAVVGVGLAYEIYEEKKAAAANVLVHA
jgi:lysozyme family protein